MVNKNRISFRKAIKITVPLSTILISLSPTFIQAVENIKDDKGGFVLEDNMKKYKPSTKWYEKETTDEMNDLFNKIDAMKSSGVWRHDGKEYKIPMSRNKETKGFQDYPTTTGEMKDPTCHQDTLDPNHASSNKQIGDYLGQEMSQRTRLMMMSADFTCGWTYSQGGKRTVPYSGLTDCSGFIYIAAKIAGTKAPATSAQYPGSPYVVEVPMSERKVGDICWKQGHVEFYLGRDKNGVERTVGAHTWGTPAGISVFNRKGKGAFTKIYRLKGADNDFTAAELAKINGK